MMDHRRYKGMKSCPNRLRLWPKTLATDELATQWAKPVWLYTLCHCIGVIDPPSLVFFIKGFHSILIQSPQWLRNPQIISNMSTRDINLQTIHYHSRTGSSFCIKSLTQTPHALSIILVYSTGYIVMKARYIQPGTHFSYNLWAHNSNLVKIIFTLFFI